jgi:hypothetical protein
MNLGRIAPVVLIVAVCVMTVLGGMVTVSPKPADARHDSGIVQVVSPAGPSFALALWELQITRARLSDV